MDLSEAYATLASPSEPSRGASTRLMHDEVERTRATAVAPTLNQPAPQLPVPSKPPIVQQQAPDKHKELRKLVIYAMVVTLGLAIHYVCHDWLTRYLSKAYLSESSEQLAKACYPACVIAAIWCIRNMK